MKINLQTKIKRNPELIWRKVRGKYFILDADAGEVRKLNETASFVWDQLERPTSILQLVKELVKNFEVKEKIAQKDILEFVKYYLDNKILLRVTLKKKD